MNLDTAIAAHAEWKTDFRAAIVNQSQMDAASISKDNCCPLGQWLHGDARTKYGQLAAFKECLGAHAIFHREAGKVAQLINVRRYSEAETALAGGMPYQMASNTAGGAIIRLKKEAGL